jgi:tetratricopeptide (TPR) repeat protein
MDDLQKLCDVNTVAVKTVANQDLQADLKASVLSHQANLYESLGKVDDAIKWNNEAYDIRLHEEPPKYHLIASFENNLGVCFNTANDHVRALEYFRKALARGDSQTMECLLVTKKNEARCLLYLDKLEEAKVRLFAIFAEFRRADLLNWAMIA